MSARIPYTVRVWTRVLDTVEVDAVTADEAMQKARELEGVESVVRAEPAEPCYTITDKGRAMLKGGE